MKLRSEMKSEYTAKMISSEKVRIGPLVFRPGYGDEIVYSIADLVLEEIYITKQFRPNDSLVRSLSFFLDGPRSYWQVWDFPFFSDSSDIDDKTNASKIELEKDFPFEISVATVPYYEKVLVPENCELTTDVHILYLKTQESVEELPDDDFVRLGRELANDLTLLVTLLSRSWVTWYRYEIKKSNVIENYVRRSRECRTTEIDWNDGLVERHSTKRFFKVAFKKIRKLRSDGFDLNMPIIFYITGCEAKYLEEKFAILFLSLEKIKDMFELEKYLENLPKKKFRKLRSPVIETIKENLETLIENKDELPKIFDTIQKKIPELNRPSLNDILLGSLFSKDRYDIEWKDIYPLGSKFTLINTRNKIFHTKQKIDIKVLVKETRRLQAIVERLLLRILGWNDFSRSPDEITKRWLTSF